VAETAQVTEAESDPLWGFGERCVNDAQYFLETLTDIVDLKSKGALVPFVFNHAQMDYYNRIWLGGIRRDIMVKSRKIGFSTQRIALGFHGAIYSVGHIFRIVAHDSDTAGELNRTVKLLFESAQRNCRRNGIDPDYILPRLKYDNKREYYFPGIESAIIVDTARGKGIGQSDRTDDLYITEYSEWDDAATKKSQLAGSIPLGSRGRITIDFNAKGIGNDAYDQYQAAKRKGHEDWNGYEACFYGIYECPDIYSGSDLTAARMEHRGKFPAVYPANDVECWLQNEVAVHSLKDITACAEGAGYLIAGHSEAAIRAFPIYHGIDTATGRPDGDWQVMKSRALIDGRLLEIEPPLRTRIPEDEFADRAWERWNKWGGMMTVEANMGMAVLLRFKQKGTPENGRLFKRKDPLNPGKSRVGFQMTYPSKRVCISDYDSLLREVSVNLPSANHVNELQMYEWKDNTELAGAPDATGKHDDELVADYVLIQGLKRERGKAHVIEKVF
jgi:hypothetical protein